MPPTPVNPAKRIAGPCLVRYKGVTFFSQGDVILDPVLATFEVQSSAYDPDPREDTLSFNVRFTPVGRVTASLLAVLYYTGNIISNRLVHHKRAFLPAAVDVAANTITITAHGFRTGHAAVFDTRDTIPGGLTANQIVYLHAVDANTITAHASEADAVAGTNPINITSQGVNTHYVIESEYLEVHSLTDDQEKYRFHNTAIVGIPTLTGRPATTPFGEITFEAFRKFGVAHTTDDAFYTYSLEVNAEAADLNYGDVITEPVALGWGNAKPFDSFRTLDGAAISFALALEAVPDGIGGIASRKITGQTITLVATPLNVSAEEVFAKRKLQGAGAGSGRRLAAGADPLNMIGDHLYSRLYGAILTASPTQYGRTVDRVGALTWQATRNYTGGAVNPLYYVGTAAPA